jgi:hypothetical protein
MLYRASNLENPTRPRQITGRYLAHNKLDARGRAELVRDIGAGQLEINTSTLTISQLTKLCRASRTYVIEARNPEIRKRRQLKKLAAIFDAIGPSARAEACREIGVERVWSALTAAL